MRHEDKIRSESIGEAIGDLCRLLTMVFCVLRACDVITWKWYWVMSPLLTVEILGLILVIITGALTINIVKDKDKNK